MLFPTARIAEHARAFLATRTPAVEARVVQLALPAPPPAPGVFAVLFPADAYPTAKQFWQHTGLGISSRRAEHCLALLLPVGLVGFGALLIGLMTP